MRDELNLIQSSLSDPNFKDPRRDKSKDVGAFRYYSVKLPERYKGLPPDWHFAILKDSDKPIQEEQRNAILRDAETLIRQRLEKNETPLVLVSDNADVNLSNNFRFEQRNVFYIDKNNLPGKKDFPRKLSNAPFIRAVRNKLDKQELSILLFKPYLPGHPAHGWRFFGRKKELDALVNSVESYFVVGARKIGKTSLLTESFHRLKNMGKAAHFVDVQDCQSSSEVVAAISRELDIHDIIKASRRSTMLNQKYLETILKKLRGNKKHITLILDELGNVIQKSRNDDWSILGTLRQYSQAGKVRVIASGFQEFYLKQYYEYEGPVVNFAPTMKLSTFSHPEVEDLLLGPLSIWGFIRDKPKLIHLITSNVGTHPYLLQHVGKYLFEKVIELNLKDVEQAACNLFNGDELSVFDEPVEELFFLMNSYAQRFVFLKRCREAELSNEPLTNAEISDDWIANTFNKLGFKTSLDGRRFMLRSLELHGLTTSIKKNIMKQRIATPIIYSFIKHSEYNIDNLIKKFAEEIFSERDQLIL
jgi:hypothetical protein